MSSLVLDYKSDFLQQREQELRDLALANLGPALQTGHYTGPEAMAMLDVEMLRLSNDIDLVSIMIKGRLLDELDTVWMFHPGKFNSLEELAAAEGKVSVTQQSIVRNLHKVVFPYVQQYLGLTISEFWDRIDKSKAAELLPYLRVLITGEKSKSNLVNTAVENLLLEVDEYEELDHPGRVKAAVSNLIDMGDLSVQQIRDKLDPNGPDKFDSVVIRKNGHVFFLAELDNDQLDLVLKKLSNKTEVAFASIKDARKVPIVRNLLGE